MFNLDSYSTNKTLDTSSPLGTLLNGGKGSGNFGHSGRPGMIGGSGSGGSKTITETYEGSYNTTQYLDKDEIKSGDHSITPHLDENGNLSAERQAVHNKIINDMAKDVPESKDPTIYFTGGGMASGKTSAVSKVFEEMPTPENKRGVVIDGDAVKFALPEGEKLKNGEVTAGYLHEEGSAISKAALDHYSSMNKYDITMDGTLSGNVEKLKKKIEAAKSGGSKAVGNFATIDVGEALKRNYLRYLSTGRYPLSKDVVKSHQSVSSNYLKLLDTFNSTNLIDNSSKTPVLIAKSGSDGKVQVLDSKRYDAFVAKSTLSKTQVDKILSDFQKNIPQYEEQWKKDNPGQTLRNRPKVL